MESKKCLKNPIKLDIGCEDRCSKTITTCLGRAITDLNCMIMSYGCLKKAFDMAVKRLYKLKEGLPVESSEPISEETEDRYLYIVKKLRENVECQLSKTVDCDTYCIPKDEKVLMFQCGKKKIGLKVPPLYAMHFLQSTNGCDKYLYFEKDPETVDYSQNCKVTYNNVDENCTLFPVWFYKYESKVSNNYTFMIDTVSEVTNFDELLDFRVLLKGPIEMECKKSVDAWGKYKLVYKCCDVELELPNPSNPSESVSPKKQGIINGLYSFAECLDVYTTETEAYIVICNTIQVLNKLSECLCKIIKSLEKLKQQLCCFCPC